MLHVTYRFLTCAAAVVVIFTALRAEGQVPPSSAPSAAPSASQPSASGGPTPIESTILAYQGLQGGANAIALAIESALSKTGLSSPAKVIIVSPSDVTAILQLRLVLFEIAALGDRLTTIEQSLKGVCGQGAKTEATLNPVSSAGDIATVLTTIGGLTASNETIAFQSNAFLDTTLVNLVGESLASLNLVSVYVPSIASPSAYDINDRSLRGTYLFEALRGLDKQRLTLENTAHSTLNPLCKSPYREAATKLVIAALAATDKFESGLFGGQLAVPATGLISAASTPAPAPGGKPGQPPAKPSPVSNVVNITNQPQKAGSPAGPSPVQRLLYVDLLLHQLGTGPESDPNFPKNTYLLSVHALESGGTELSKSQVFLGTRQYYSGGAVATFSLVKSNGTILCSGLAYGYRGYIAAGDFSYAVEPVATESAVTTPGTANALPNVRVDKPSCPLNLHSF